MKKNYEKPVMQVEVFIPNDYIAGCYHVHCKTDAQNGNYRYLYLDSNNNQTLDTSDELVYSTPYGSFRGCNIVHTGVQSEGDLALNAFVTTQPARYQDGAYTTRVYAWRQHTTQYGDWHVCYDPTSAEYISDRPNAS